MKKIEKPTIKHKPISSPINNCPYGNLEKLFPEAQGKLIYVEEAVVLSDDFKPPAAYYANDALGGSMYFKTNSRQKAQLLCDYVFGGGKYIIKAVIRAQVR